MSSNDEPKKKQQSKNELEGVGMDELLRIYDEKMAEFSEGDIVRGRVVQVNANEILIDIGYKSEGMLPIGELRFGDVEIKRGDEVDVYIERLEGPSGHTLVSREKAARVRVWDKIEEAFKADQPINGRVLDRVKGGLAVDVGGVRAFLPGSQVDVRPIKNLDVLRGKEYDFKIVSFDKRRNNIVLSRRAILEVEYAAKKKETFATLQEGMVTHGVVKNITDYGVFVDLGGVDGLLHITDISWGRVNHPSEFFNVADEIEVVVLKFDPTTERVSLGFKQRTPDPWGDVALRYPIGSKVHGKVVSLTDYGAFIELEEGVEGLVHISEMSWTRKVHPSKLLAAGTDVESVVTDVNVANRRISLSLRALEQNPWDSIGERYPVGSTVNGKVRNLTDFGAFIELEEGIDGLVHISDISWTRRLKHPSEVLKKGDDVTARVINVDPDNQRLSLSIKEFMPNEWDTFAKDRQIGDDVTGTVSKITDFGLFIELGEGVEGLAHISEIPRDPKVKLDRIFRPGDEVRARIIKIDWTEKKIGLTLKDVDQPNREESRGTADDAASDEAATHEAATDEPAAGDAASAEPAAGEQKAIEGDPEAES
ncbi:MAG: 30S ribosomal protein S1 [Acidobacteria bacterium]|nr:30S ribosomal protein S1 [Acidobacteriota bacterium]